MKGAEKKKLLKRLSDEAKEFIDEYLEDDLENNVDYNDPKLQSSLYWLAIYLRKVMAIAINLREKFDYNFEGGGVTLALDLLLDDIKELWPEKAR